MKFFLAILTFASLALASVSQAQSTGDVQLGVKSSSGPLTPVWVTKTASRVIGWDSSGVLGPITVTAGSAAWADVTGKPTTLAGYGITDSITAALAASTYQPLITDGSLTIARTSGLQAALDALDAKETALTFSTGLTRSTNTITVNAVQNITRLSNLTGNGFVKTSGSDGTLSIDTSTYQPLAGILTTISGLSGVSQGGNGTADGGKLVKFVGTGALFVTDEIEIFATTGGGGTAIVQPASVTFNTITLPTASGTLSITSDITLANLGGLGTGIGTALAINAGSAGAPVLLNGAGGTPSSITLTNATGTAASLIAGYATQARGLQVSGGSVSVINASVPSAGQVLTALTSSTANFQSVKAEIVVACSDETTALTTGTAKVTFRMPFAATLSSVRLNVNTAPTGSVIIVDVKEAGTTIFSTKPQIATSAFTSVGGAVPGVLSDTALADDAEITINIDQIGSTIAGKGLKVTFIFTRQ